MKKIIFCLAIMCSSLFATQSEAASIRDHNTSAVVLPKDSAEAAILLLRLDEISTTDKSTMKPSDKRGLRKEVRSIKHRLNEIGGGVYISAGAVILIVILLIILL